MSRLRPEPDKDRAMELMRQRQQFEQERRQSKRIQDEQFNRLIELERKINKGKQDADDTSQ